MMVSIGPGMTRYATADEAAAFVADYYSLPNHPATVEHLSSGLYFRVEQDLGSGNRSRMEVTLLTAADGTSKVEILGDVEYKLAGETEWSK